MGIFGERLVTRLNTQTQWPHPVDAEVWDQLETWIAFRESDRVGLRHRANWKEGSRDYLIDPLPEKIAEAFADLIWGKAPKITAANAADKTPLEELVADNQLPQELKRAEDQCSSEGEVWWRLLNDPERFTHPRVEFWSRLDVIPVFSGKDLKAVGFIDLLPPRVGDGDDVFWRHFEIVDEQDIMNVLFCGTKYEIGDKRKLTEHPATEDLEESEPHELPAMPAGRIPNKLGRNVAYGRSDYAGIEDYLYALNETLTVGKENMRMTLKRRVVVPASAVDEAGNVTTGEAIVVEMPDMASGKDAVSNQFQVLEYSFDAEALIKYQNSLAEQALTRVGITPAYIGVSTNEPQGRAITGTALRLRLMPSINAGEARAQPWDVQLPVMLMLLQIIEARAEDDGGYGIQWADAGTAPGVDRGESLPQDEVEEAQRHTILISAGAESIRTAIADMHPDWDVDRVEEEWAKILEENEKLKPGIGPKLFDTNAPAPTITPI
jgi:hypothetical protein